MKDLILFLKQKYGDKNVFVSDNFISVKKNGKLLLTVNILTELDNV